MKKNRDATAVQNTLKGLEKDFLVLGKTRVNPWEAWLAILVAIGIFFGIVISAQRSEDFVLECDFYTNECGGLWTHSVVHGELKSVFSSIPGEFKNSLSVPHQVANAIGAVPGFSLFALGFVSSALIFGLVWEKLTFLPRETVKKRKISRKRGFISKEYMIMFFLAIFLTLVLSSPVSLKSQKNSGSGFRGTQVASAFTSSNQLLESGKNILNKLNTKDSDAPSEDTKLSAAEQTSVFFPMTPENTSLPKPSSETWYASSIGVVHIYIADVSNLLSIRKNGVEIWDKSLHSMTDLKMEFFVLPSDTVEFVVWNEENLNSNIEVLPIAEN